MSIPSGYSNAAIQPNETLTCEELLDMFLIHSANEIGIIFAEHISGSVENFATLMNKKASEIGCKNTNFTNPYGCHNENHYSTAYDLCLIANYAMQNEVFRQIVSTKTYTTSPTSMSESKKLMNTNRLLHQYNREDNSENIFYYEYATGIKTGYTEQAKNCLVASAKKDNIEYIAVILSSQTSEDNYNSQRYSDTKNLFSTAFENYSLHTIKNMDDIITTVEIPNGDFIRRNLNLKLENNIEILINNKDLETDLTPEIILNEEKIQAPISKGDVLGTLSYTYNGTTYTENLLASTGVATEEQMNTYFKIAVSGLIILLTFTIIEVIRKK